MPTLGGIKLGLKAPHISIVAVYLGFRKRKKLIPTFFQPVHRLALKQIHDIPYTYIQAKPGTSRRRDQPQRQSTAGYRPQPSPVEPKPVFLESPAERNLKHHRAQRGLTLWIHNQNCLTTYHNSFQVRPSGDGREESG
jgi:hypothetical protein